MNARTKNDRGAALLMVLGLGLVMILLVATGLTVATSGLRQSTASQRSISALDAAYAGAQDYLARVNTDSTYTQYGNPASTFAPASKATLPTSSTNPAFGIGAAGSWALVPGSDGKASFRYEVDNATYAKTGSMRLRVTGRSGDRVRTLVVNLRVRGFVDYSYFTDYEIQDPQVTGANPKCEAYAYSPRPAGVDCKESQFGKDDVVSGDVHSNDVLRICGAKFLGTVTTAYAKPPYYATPDGCSNSGLTVKKADALKMPSTNTTMKRDAGCLYTGPTEIKLRDDGRMTVWSPWSKKTRIDEDGVASTPAECGSPADLRSKNGARIDQLDDDLVYVQNVPSVAGDPNRRDPTDATDKPSGLSCIAADNTVTTGVDGIGWESGSLRYPRTDEAPAMFWDSGTGASARWKTITPAYGCRNGDAYVSGTVKGQMTIASENYVYVVDDVYVKDKNEDLLGLVGQNSVIVWNPMRYESTTTVNGQAIDTFSPLLSEVGREIDAAVISVAHTFQVQNYARGSSRGALYVYGSIAQKFRGTTRRTYEDGSSSGYTKSYAYNPLLKSVSPPKFLASTATSFYLTRYSTVRAAFASTGEQQ